MKFIPLTDEDMYNQWVRKATKKKVHNLNPEPKKDRTKDRNRKL